MIKNHMLRRWVSLATAALVLIQPALVFARGGFRGGGGGGGGFGGGGGGGFRGGGGGGGFSGGGGGGYRGGGGGGFQGGGNRGGGGGFGGGGHSPSFSGGGSRPGGGGGFGGGGTRPGGGGAGTRNPIAGGGAGGNRNPFDGGNRNNFNGGNRGNFDGGNRGNFNGNNNRGNFNNRGNINTGNVGNRTNVGGRTNIGNNTNIANKSGNFSGNTINRGGNTYNNFNRTGNNNWNHGAWNGNWAGGWHNGSWWNGYAHGAWGAHPWATAAAWGTAAWALGSIFYDCGYGGGGGSYSNPYYSVDDSSTVYNYSQPIQSNYQPQPADAYEPPPVAPAVTESASLSDKAAEAFKAGDYAGAMTNIDAALKKNPKDAALHEFRALVLFATQKYDEAAGVLYAVLSAGPGWNWTTLSSLYPSVDTYTAQLRQLEQYVKANKNSAAGHFVLAYQYITCDHKEPAIRELKDVLMLQPKDDLSSKLITMLGGTPPAGGAAPTAQDGSASDTPAQQPADVDGNKLIGDWTATRATDNSKFDLKLTSDKKFTWGYTRGDKHNEFGGTWSMDGAVLVLVRADGGQMPGLVTLGSDGFNYKMYGGPPDDKGLDFKK